MTETYCPTCVERAVEFKGCRHTHLVLKSGCYQCADCDEGRGKHIGLCPDCSADRPTLPPPSHVEEPTLKIYVAKAKITGRLYWLNAHDPDEARRVAEYCAHDDHGGAGDPCAPFVIDTVRAISAAAAATIGFPVGSNERIIGLRTILDASRHAAIIAGGGGVFTCNAWWNE